MSKMQLQRRESKEEAAAISLNQIHTASEDEDTAIFGTDSCTILEPCAAGGARPARGARLCRAYSGWGQRGGVGCILDRWSMLSGV